MVFSFIAAKSNLDHDTTVNFLQLFMPEIGKSFVKVLMLAQQVEVLQLERIILDDDKIKANASKHEALNYLRAC